MLHYHSPRSSFDHQGSPGLSDSGQHTAGLSHQANTHVRKTNTQRCQQRLPVMSHIPLDMANNSHQSHPIAPILHTNSSQLNMQHRYQVNMNCSTHGNRIHKQHMLLLHSYSTQIHILSTPMCHYVRYTRCMRCPRSPVCTRPVTHYNLNYIDRNHCTDVRIPSTMCNQFQT